MAYIIPPAINTTAIAIELINNGILLSVLPATCVLGLDFRRKSPFVADFVLIPSMGDGINLVVIFGVGSVVFVLSSETEAWVDVKVFIEAETFKVGIGVDIFVGVWVFGVAVGVGVFVGVGVLVGIGILVGEGSVVGVDVGRGERVGDGPDTITLTSDDQSGEPQLGVYLPILKKYVPCPL